MQVEEDDTWEKQGTCVEVSISNEELLVASRFNRNYDYFSNQQTKSDPQVDIFRESALWRECERRQWNWLKAGEYQSRGALRFGRSPEGGMNIWDSANYILFHLECKKMPPAGIRFKGKVR